MTAERLRAAAALMRSQAGAAIPGPWVAEVLGSEGYAIMGPPIDPESTSARRRLRRWVARVGMNDWQVDKDTAAHIASWSPVVALAVADWLDAVADEPWCCDEDKFDPVNDNRLVLAAVAVAEAYLGGA